jgi:serine/threonine-protein kinase
MKVCPQCAREYDANTKFCLEDGVALVDKEQRAKDPLIGVYVDRDRQYQITAVLGEGGMGKVYKGRQESVGRDVAIKTLHKQLLENEQLLSRFKREAKTACALKHQHSVEVNTFGQIEAPGKPYDGIPYMVMEFVTGKPLTKAIEQSKRLDEARSIHIMLQVCEVLEEAHRLGIVHRDLKPDNIVLTERGRNKDYVKILDFGIAKIKDESEGGTGTKLTQAGTVFGTPQYLSPEQAAGTPVDHRSDIYSMGIILYEMLTGRVPFHADSAVGFLLKHVSETPVPPRQFEPSANISEEMERIILKAIEKDPAHRHQSVSELGDALQAIQPNARSTASHTPLPGAMGGVGATMRPGGPPPGMVSGQAPTMMPGGTPPGMVNPASNTGNGTLQPVVVHTPAPAGSGKGALIAVLSVLILGGGGAGAYLFLNGKSKKTDAASASIVAPTPTPATPAGTPPTTPNPVANGNPTPVTPNPVNPTPVTPNPVNPVGETPQPVNPTPVTPNPVNPTPVNPTPAVPAAELVTVTFRSKPKGADVLINGAKACTTPCNFELAAKTPVSVAFMKDGFIPETKLLTPNGDQDFGANLKPAEFGSEPSEPSGDKGSSDTSAEDEAKKAAAKKAADEAKKAAIKKKLEGGSFLKGATGD